MGGEVESDVKEWIEYSVEDVTEFVLLDEYLKNYRWNEILGGSSYSAILGNWFLMFKQLHDRQSVLTKLRLLWSENCLDRLPNGLISREWFESELLKLICVKLSEKRDLQFLSPSVGQGDKSGYKICCDGVDITEQLSVGPPGIVSHYRGFWLISSRPSWVIRRVIRRARTIRELSTLDDKAHQDQRRQCCYSLYPICNGNLAS